MLNSEVNKIVRNPSLLKYEDGIYTYFEDEDIQNRITKFLVAFTQYRESSKALIKDIAVLKSLPFSIANNEWKQRQETLKIVKQNLVEGEYYMLEVGGWNGWLSKYLAEFTPNFITVDYFTDAMDGLRAVNHYENKWTAIQCDLSKLDFFTIKFDVILVNHCIAYCNEPIEQVEHLRTMLNPGGKILLMGFPVIGNPKRKIKHLKKLEADFEMKYGMSLYINPVKGYLTYNDLETLKEFSFVNKAYKTSIKQRIKRFLLPWAEVQQYAIGHLK